MKPLKQEKTKTTWQTKSPDSRHVVEVEVTKIGIFFWRYTKNDGAFREDRVWSRWVPLPQAPAVDEAFRQAYSCLGDIK